MLFGVYRQKQLNMRPSVKEATFWVAVGAAVLGASLPLETSENCYDTLDVFVGHEPDGVLVPSTLSVQRAAIWIGLAGNAAVVFRPKANEHWFAISAVAIFWALTYSGLVSISEIVCEDDKLSSGFFCAHIANMLFPYVLFL